MKNTIKLMTIAAVVALFGCKKDNSDLEYVNYDQDSLTIVFTIKANSQDYFNESTTLTIDLDEIAEANGISASSFKSLKIKKAHFWPFPDTSSSIENLQIAIGDSPETPILSKKEIPKTSNTSIDLDVINSSDVLPILRKENVKIRLWGDLNGKLDEDKMVWLKIEYTLNAAI